MIAYLDMPSGISGDMFLGCLVDAGWSIEALQRVITGLRLPMESWSVHAESVMRGPLQAMLVHVDVAEGGHHRHLHDIRQIIESADLPAMVQEKAIAVFTRLAQAEAQVHGTDIESIHFHEVGALDAIIDIVGVTAGLYELEIEQLYASGVPLAEGWTHSAHGRIPLPAPATLTLLTEVHAPNRPAPGSGELVTPTGAALLAEFAIFAQPHMQLQRIGLGTGQKDFAWPNVARLWLATPQGLERSSQPSPGGSTPDLSKQRDESAKQLVQIETNIDDMNPEFYPAVSQKLFAAGALDVWTAPIYMKKGRPGVLLTVLGQAVNQEALANILLRETTTLGVRIHAVYRQTARRELHTIQTPYGEVQVKLKWLENRLVGAKPEYENCLALAEREGIPVRIIYETALVAVHQQFAFVNE